ncbi:MAG TPA: TRAM domain-containing protein, partial [Clostridia bacterium]|nr:TRAM domain-containing protein [Clostridia bacterium]
KVCPHIHLPVQSGSDRVLCLMNRRYTRADYLALAAALRAAVPGIEITTDFIVGFPGETEEDFLDSLRLAREAGFSAAYTFKYSKRSGTRAAGMEEQIPEQVKKDRLKRLNDAVAEGLRAGNEKYVGRTGEVLVEGCDRRNAAMAFGKLPSFKMVYFPGGESLIGRTVRVNITKTSVNSLIGELADQKG